MFGTHYRYIVNKTPRTPYASIREDTRRDLDQNSIWYSYALAELAVLWMYYQNIFPGGEDLADLNLEVPVVTVTK